MAALGHVVPQFHHLVAGSTPFLQILTMAAATWQLVNESDGAWLHSFLEGGSLLRQQVVLDWVLEDNQQPIVHGPWLDTTADASYWASEYPQLVSIFQCF